jgi:hypothetical protein
VYQSWSRSIWTSLWKSIRKVWPQFVDSTYFKVGNGAHLKFWHHQWCGETSLKSRFPGLFRLASHPEASVKDLACLRVLTSIGM